MKKLAAFLFFVFPLFSFAQNLVFNSGFEEYEKCPDEISDLYRCKGWETPNHATTDYYNSCSNHFTSAVPFNFAGKQKPKEGKGYIGIVVDQKNIGYTELAQGKLIKPLKKGKYYKVSYYVSPGEISRYFTNELGVLFSRDSIFQDWYSFNVSGKYKKYLVKNMKMDMPDNLDKWYLVSGIYKARGGEKYLIIGNNRGSMFYSPIKKNKILKSRIRQRICYCYVDDVQVVEAKRKKDNEFSKEVYSSSSEIVTGTKFSLTFTNRVFQKNTSQLINYRYYSEQMRQDSGFIPHVAYLDYLSNTLRQNKSLVIQINVYPESSKIEKEEENLTLNRASKIVSYLRKKGGKKQQLRMKIIDSNTKSGHKNKEGLIEIEILSI